MPAHLVATAITDPAKLIGLPLAMFRICVEAGLSILQQVSNLGQEIAKLFV